MKSLLERVRDWIDRAAPIILAADARFEYEVGVGYIVIDTASTSAFEGTSVKIEENGTVTTTGDAAGFPDFFGHPRGGETSMLSDDTILAALENFLNTWRGTQRATFEGWDIGWLELEHQPTPLLRIFENEDTSFGHGMENWTRNLATGHHDDQAGWDPNKTHEVVLDVDRELLRRMIQELGAAEFNYWGNHQEYKAIFEAVDAVLRQEPGFRQYLGI